MGNILSKKIIFTKMMEVSEEYSPKPSSSFLPEWYKNTDSYLDQKRDVIFPRLETNATIKKCIPVFDVLTAGYIIPTYCDLIIKKDPNGEILYLSPLGAETITFHEISQAPYHPRMNYHKYPKWTNPWSIQTPKGYSCLFIPPVHGGNKYFTIAEGFVDTDKYRSPINFPFVLNDINFEGIIPAGTPLVQVIPIKRDSWTSEIQIDSTNSKNDANLLQSIFFDRYKTLFWNRKSFK